MQNQLFLNKQPILDAQQNLYGYQFSMETHGGDAQTGLEDQVKSFCSDLNDLTGMANLTAGKPAFYRAPTELLKLALLPPIEPLSSLTVEVSMDVLKDAGALANLKEMIQEGLRLLLQTLNLLMLRTSY